MARIDLHNFFKFYDEKNPNHIKAVQWLEDNLPVKYLEDNIDWAEIYRGKKGNAAPASTSTASAPVAGGDDMPMTGLKLIKEFEGCHLKAYPDPLSGGLPITIGWGTTRKKDGSPFHMGDTITQQEADELLINNVRTSFFHHFVKSHIGVKCLTAKEEHFSPLLIILVLVFMVVTISILLHAH